ncbi:MAG: hypothetical protein Q9192_008183 [Flavoplaca navasiana]
MSPSSPKKQIFTGTFIHVPSLSTGISVLENTIVGVDECGVIAFIQRDVEGLYDYEEDTVSGDEKGLTVAVRGVLVNNGWEGLDVEVVESGRDGMGWWGPGFVGELWILTRTPPNSRIPVSSVPPPSSTGSKPTPSPSNPATPPSLTPAASTTAPSPPLYLTVLRPAPTMPLFTQNHPTSSPTSASKRGKELSWGRYVWIVKKPARIIIARILHRRVSRIRKLWCSISYPKIHEENWCNRS